MQKRVMIVAGEASSEMFGALLAKQLKAIEPEVALYGMGGVRMEREGVKIITMPFQQCILSSSDGIF